MPLALTLAGVDAVLIARVGAWYAAVGLSTAINGTNPDTQEPWRFSLDALGITPAAYPTVADGDFAAIVPDAPGVPGTLAQLLDVAELAARRKALDAFLLADRKVDKDEQKNDQVAQRWQRRVDDLAEYCRVKYGLGADTLDAGTIDLGFQQPRCWGDPGYGWY